jgi:hypothetical protein
MACLEQQRKRFIATWRGRVGTSTAALLFNALYFSQVGVKDPGVKVTWTTDNKTLTASCTNTRSFSLSVIKDGTTVTLTINGRSTCVADLLDLALLVPTP